MGFFLLFSLNKTGFTQNIIDVTNYVDQLNQVQFDTALSLAAQGQFRDANELLLNLFNRTKSPRVLLEGARVLYLGGDFDEAEVLFKKILLMNPPMMVRERVKNYLESISNLKGRIDVSFGLVKDSNPKLITSSRTLIIYGQKFSYNPQVDTSSQWGLSYLINGYKNFGSRKEWGAGFYVNGAKFSDQVFNRTSVEEFLTYKFEDIPKLTIKTAAEQYFFSEKLLYNMPSVSLKHTNDGAFGKYWTNEIKAGRISYQDYKYLDGNVRSYITTFGSPISANLILGFELGFDRTTAEDKSFAFKSRSAAGVATHYLPSIFVKSQLRYSVSKRNYDAVDKFFEVIRSDKRNGIYLNLQKTDWNFFGLSPSLDFGMEKNKSNIDLYSYKRLISMLTFKKAY